MSKKSVTYKVIVIAGPTAGGKSARAMKIAKENNGVIINADSMQVYDALPILTACPSQEEMEQIHHRLYCFLSPSEKCTAAFWREKALEEIERAINENLTPVITGGTGFYISALTEGLSPVPPVPEDVREQVFSMLEEMGNQKFHELLSERDPEIAGRLHQNDSQRIMRAMEVLIATGKSLAVWQSLPKEAPPEYLSFETEIVMPEREALYSNIENRFDHMIEMGALDEVSDLMEKIECGEISEDTQITGALGYNHLSSYLREEISLQEAVDLSKTQTRQYAKRQTTWFKRHGNL